VELIPLLLFSPVLVVVAISDLRQMRIPNRLSLIALALFVGSCFVLPMNEISLRLFCAALVFCVGFLLYVFRILGGGDVKMLSATMLFVPSSSLVLFAYVFSASMLAGILFIVILRNLPLRLEENWVSMQENNSLPMGISIALAGILHLLLLAVPF